MPDTTTVPDCPACDTALAPEALAPGCWLCPCCATTWREAAPAPPPAPADEDHHA